MHLATQTRNLTARWRFLLAMSLAATWPWLAGCGGEGADVVPVSGTVTLNGQPLEGAAIVFTPAPNNMTGTAGSDATGPEGNYKAQHDGRFGLAPGKYVVLITKEHNPTTLSDQFKMEDASGNMVMDPEMARVAAESLTQGGGSAAPKAKITKVEETFDREISATEKNILDFDLKATAADAKILRGD